MPPPAAQSNSLTPRRWLSTLARRERARLALAACFGVLSGAQTILLVVGLAWSIEQLVVHGRSPVTLVPVLLGLVVAVALRSLFLALQESLSATASLRIRQYAREQVLNKVAALGPVWMTRQQSGALATQSVEHIEALDGYFARFLPQMRIVLLLPLLIAVVVGWLDYLVAIFLLLSAPLIPLFMALVGMGQSVSTRSSLLPLPGSRRISSTAYAA
ncbi:hypothetical protein HAALTHF_35630n [Vreelandella aquamarina]|nr:hypothetical protein HAALTHF_35630n [Halomonas axialensis]